MLLERDTALTQRSISEYLTPVRPRATSSSDFQQLEVEGCGTSVDRSQMIKNIKILCRGDNVNKVLSDIKEQSELVDVKESQNPDNEGLLPTPSVISDDATQTVECQIPALALNLETNDDITGGPGLDELCDRWQCGQELNIQVCQEDLDTRTR